MQIAELEREYEQILERSRENGEIHGAQGGSEKRRHPRLSVDSQDMWISTVPEFSVIDMSMSGMAFHSNHPLEAGEVIHIALGAMLSVDATVRSCKLEEAPSEYLDAQFRIQCEFLQDYSGMELLVSLKGRLN